LDDGLVTGNLHGVGESTLTVAPDAEKVQNAISDFVSELNSFIGFLEENEDYVKDEVLVSINGFVSAHKSALESLGITGGDDEALEVDTERLGEAVRQNLSTIKETFGGLDGLAVNLDSYASLMATDSPLSYAKEATNMPMEFTDYLYGASARMLQYMLQGSLLDNYV
jgi:flagellar hook-associated protein 2